MIDFTVPAFDRLLQAVLNRATHRDSIIHGESHWRAVTYTALELAPRVPGSDPLVGFFFGLLHDSQRLNDGSDPQHGPRAALVTRELFDERLLPVTAHQLDHLTKAIHDHTSVLATITAMASSAVATAVTFIPHCAATSPQTSRVAASSSTINRFIGNVA